MRRSVALVCLASLLTATAVSSTTQDPPKVPEPFVPTPKILSPQPGDTPLTSDVIVTVSSACGPADRPTPRPGEYRDATQTSSGSRLWTYTITGFSADTKIKTCCKSETHPSPPHGPCSLETLIKKSVAVTGAATGAAKAVAPARAFDIPTYRPGRIELSKPFPTYDPAAAQSVYVVLENEDVTNPQCHRSQAATADVFTTGGAAHWRTCFDRVSPGIYVVRYIVISRAAPPIPNSYVIEVKW